MSQFWADELAERAIARHGAPYVVSDTKTPSGHVHVGSLRGVIVHDAVARALATRGVAVRSIFGFDDFDPFDKVPSYLDQEAYAPFLGQPFTTVPAPDERGIPGTITTDETNYGRFYADEFEAVYRQLGVGSETLYSSVLYARGDFNDAIRLALDHASEIKGAYEAVLLAHRSVDRREKSVGSQFPLSVVCEGCRRIATTVVNDWNGTTVSYECRTGVVPYVDGCGHHGSVSPFDGNAKLPWKVEWAAKWYSWQTDVEGAGKDHYTKGGSRDVAAEIFRRVFAPAVKPGYDRVPEDLFYEWFYLGGKKMSTSKGVGIFARDILDQLPAELLRFLMVRVRPRSGVDFDPTSATIAQLFDEYDRVLTLANQDSTSVEAAITRAALIEPKELPQHLVRFSKITNLLEHNAKSADEVRRLTTDEKGSSLSENERAELDRRIEFAQAGRPDESASSIDSTPLETDQRTFLAALVARLQAVPESEWAANRLRDQVYEAKNETGIESKRAFQAIYRAVLGTDAGPRAGDLFVQRGRTVVLNALERAVE